MEGTFIKKNPKKKGLYYSRRTFNRSFHGLLLFRTQISRISSNLMKGPTRIVSFFQNIL